MLDWSGNGHPPLQNTYAPIPLSTYGMQYRNLDLFFFTGAVETGEDGHCWLLCVIANP